ncbi:MAG: hypothetical protein N3E47_02135 [Candidatus Bathyarchaeota archaeon]|nr:hypothetical protein [Candidatus Bathyarchaeota archaeon]
MLLLSEAIDVTRVTVSCTSCGHTYHESMRSYEVLGFTQSLVGRQCPKCGNPTLEVVEEKDLIEELAEIAEAAGSRVEVISPETEEGQMLLKSFGGIAATLRYKMEQH